MSLMCRWVPGQFVAGQFVADNSSRTIRRGQFVAKYKINFIESTASISATLFTPIPLPLQQYSFHQSRFHFINILFTNPASISAKLSCLQIYLLQDFIVCL